MTGGGFGGSVIAIAKKGTGKNLAEEIVTRYWNQFKIEAKIIS
jgi:galactokinase